jgi:hypothetical protein
LESWHRLPTKEYVFGKLGQIPLISFVLCSCYCCCCSVLYCASISERVVHEELLPAVTSAPELPHNKTQSTLELWRRLPTKEYVFGRLGQTSSPPIFQHMTKRSVHCHNQNKSMCWSVSPNMCAPGAFRDENNMFVRKRSKYCYKPSPRISNWTENKVRWLHHKENIIRKSANFLKGTNKKTHP